MALTQCPECMTEVSDKALTCTKCGVQLRKPKRGFFGQIIKYTFILFNLFMAWGLFNGMQAASKTLEATASAAEQAGAAIGTGVGATMIITLWVFGDIILGLFVLFTRPK
ncbi:zinc ribbon domain-containing protein [Shewanella baltica]|uniref:zinc ribbon domain-containing protein n=1 Tax=Shewanella baltica TaxID=62322 RepID=UPI0030D23084